MSREILFKAKRANWRELPKEEWWVEGNLVWTNDAFEEYKAIIIPKENSVMFTKSENDDLGFENWYLVDPETICQYTGLDDKDRRKIFEGDILGIEAENLSKEDGCFVVEWSEPSSCFVACGKSYLAHFDNVYEDCREVIGNIFDNPELLKAGQQSKSP